ncbi:hypothetical protein CHARACLAT_014745 [Characodon lateralis]|uniref:Uncharacterized protein n=1 Tax=Characodon lateralis TaxID=208331 RepID=A0ABU7EKT6_9TELE|nr:hypothetical protein [Characodon lateralis]
MLPFLSKSLLMTPHADTLQPTCCQCLTSSVLVGRQFCKKAFFLQLNLGAGSSSHQSGSPVHLRTNNQAHTQASGRFTETSEPNSHVFGPWEEASKVVFKEKL